MYKTALFLLIVSMLFLSGCNRPSSERVEWTAMGTVAAMQTRGLNAKSHAHEWRGIAQRFFAVRERMLSAHDPNSELSRLAPLTEGEILAQCCYDVSNCYAAAFRLMHESEGAFNLRWRGPGTLDLGAIAKGFVLDDFAATHRCLGFPDVLLDLGGNLKSCSGDWQIGIAGSDIVITLKTGMACATSAEYFRGKHIYDGRTGFAVSNDVKSVTVVHPTSAMLADGLSTTLFILGREKGEAFLKEYYPEARAIWIMRPPE